jgi:hypothetical protein
MKFKDMVARAAAARCFNSGQSVEQIARSAKKKPATIRGWLTEAGIRSFKKGGGHG